MKIEYKNIRHGYAKINKEGQLLITIPLRKKNDQLFINKLIKKGEHLLQHYNKKIHIKALQKNTILLFGEYVPLEDIKKQYCKKSGTCNLKFITTKIFKKIFN